MPSGCYTTVSHVTAETTRRHDLCYPDSRQTYSGQKHSLYFPKLFVTQTSFKRWDKSYHYWCFTQKMCGSERPTEWYLPTSLSNLHCRFVIYWIKFFLLLYGQYLLVAFYVMLNFTNCQITAKHEYPIVINDSKILKVKIRRLLFIPKTRTLRFNASHYQILASQVSDYHEF